MLGVHQIFLAHPSSASLSDIASWVGTLAALLPEIDPEAIIPARVSMRRHMSSVGGWEAWYRWVADAYDLSGFPFYSVMICPKQWVGKRTHRLVEEFLRAAKPVYLLDGGELIPVLGVKVDDAAALDEQGEPQNWSSSWVLCLERSV